jgi:hypothetical protein
MFATRIPRARRLLTSAVLYACASVHASAQAPVVTVVAPTPAQEVRGLVGLSAAASGEGVVSVQFRVDGADVGKAVAPGSCCVMWDSRTSSDGFHTVQAIGRDRFGNVLTSQPVTFLVNNFTPEPSPTPAKPERQPPADEPGFTAASISGAIVKRPPEATPARDQPTQSSPPETPKPPATSAPATSTPQPRAAASMPSAAPTPPLSPSRTPAPTAATTPASAPAPPAATAAKVSCNRPDPFEAIGGVGICIGGEWVLLWKPVK